MGRRGVCMAFLVWLAGCDRIFPFGTNHDEPHDRGSSDGPQDRGGREVRLDRAPPGDTGCRSWSDFAPADSSALKAVNSQFDEWDPFISVDGLTLVFASYQQSANDLWISTRARTADAFPAPRRLDELQLSWDDVCPFLTRNGLTLYFSSSRAGGGDRAIYRATRSSEAAPFGAPERVNELFSPGWNLMGSLSPDELTIYFVSDREGGYAAFTAVRADKNSAFSSSSIKRLSVPGAPQQIYDASLSHDGKDLFLTAGSGGEWDLYLAHRDSPTASFATPAAKLANLSTPNDDCCASLAGDGTTLVYIGDADFLGMLTHSDFSIARRVCTD